jgi:SAM-dependent methyltransferase
MIESTSAEAERMGVKNMRFERVDAEELAYPDATFDAVLCVLGLMFPADPQRAIDQIGRVLKPGGRAAVCVWGRRERCGWSPIFPIVESRVESDVCPLFFQLGFEGALTRAFTKAVFADVTEERVTRSLDFPGAPEMLAAVFKGGAVALAYSRFSDEVREEVHSEFLQEAEPHRRNGGYSLPGEFVFALARKAKS